MTVKIFASPMVVVQVVAIAALLGPINAAAGAAPATVALIECENIHRIEFHRFPSASAHYDSSGCALSCLMGETVLAVSPVFEGRPCPTDGTGICHSGQCTGGEEQALSECGTRHGLDFHRMANHAGSGFSQDRCSLTCVLDQVQLSHAPVREGKPCTAVSSPKQSPNQTAVSDKGTCQQGHCKATVEEQEESKPNPSSHSSTMAPTTIGSDLEVVDMWLDQLNDSMHTDDRLVLELCHARDIIVPHGHTLWQCDPLCTVVGPDFQGQHCHPGLLSQVKLSRQASFSVVLSSGKDKAQVKASPVANQVLALLQTVTFDRDSGHYKSIWPFSVRRATDGKVVRMALHFLYNYTNKST